MGGVGALFMTKPLDRGIKKEGVLVEENGKTMVLAADTVVLAMGARSDRELLEGLEAAKVEVHAIGDCVVPRRIVQATSQGFQVGNCA